MSINPLFTTKKRDLSVLHSTNRVNASISSAVQQSVYSSCNDQGTYPLSKRFRSTSITESKVMEEDVFGDGEDFTADDLEEIDIIASQAYTQDSRATNSRTNHVQEGVRSGSRQTSAFLQPQRPSKRGRDTLNSRTDNETIDALQSRHEDLKQKLKVLEDEIIVKNGEIKVLRDALRQTESNLEQQKIAHVVLEKEKTQMQCEKEKELLKKIQSLQSELQFKDAEMIELKTKLQSSERKALIPQVSPKKSSLKPETCPSPQPGKSNFPTKESFRANTCLKPLMPVSPSHMRIPVKSDTETLATTITQAKVFTTSYCKQTMDRQGSVLLSNLMQQSDPLDSLGLYHLLSTNLGSLPVSAIQRAQANNTAGTSSSSIMSPSQCAALKECQKLAISGLNSIALGEEEMDKKGTQCQRGRGHLNKMWQLTGALHILPLVEFHITLYYQALHCLEKSEGGSADNQSMSSSSTDSGIIVSAEDTISRFTDPALASLDILYHLVFHSLDVVETLLQKSTTGIAPSGTEQEPNVVINRDLEKDEEMLHPLFKKIVLLLSSSVVTYKREIIQEKVLRVLVKLAENCANDQLTRFQGLLSSPVLLQCLSPNASLSMVHKSVQLLALLADDKRLSGHLCSCSENCPLLALFMFIISKPDKQASEKLWLQTEHEVVRFLNKLIIQGWSFPSTRSGVTCQCNREMVKALVLTLHLEWLHVRRLPVLLPTPNQNKTMLFLKEAVIVLHSLYQRDKCFSEHCLDVFHQYDQVVPGVRVLFRKFNTLNENEEFALDELCPPEIETEDESMDCT